MNDPMGFMSSPFGRIYLGNLVHRSQATPGSTNMTMAGKSTMNVRSMYFLLKKVYVQAAMLVYQRILKFCFPRCGFD